MALPIFSVFIPDKRKDSFRYFEKKNFGIKLEREISILMTILINYSRKALRNSFIFPYLSLRVSIYGKKNFNLKLKEGGKN